MIAISDGRADRLVCKNVARRAITSYFTLSVRISDSPDFIMCPSWKFRDDDGIAGLQVKGVNTLAVMYAVILARTNPLSVQCSGFAAS